MLLNVLLRDWIIDSDAIIAARYVYQQLQHLDAWGYHLPKKGYFLTVTHGTEVISHTRDQLRVRYIEHNLLSEQEEANTSIFFHVVERPSQRLNYRYRWYNCRMLCLSTASISGYLRVSIAKERIFLMIPVHPICHSQEHATSTSRLSQFVGIGVRSMGGITTWHWLHQQNSLVIPIDSYS